MDRGFQSTAYSRLIWLQCFDKIFLRDGVRKLSFYYFPSFLCERYKDIPSAGSFPRCLQVQDMARLNLGVWKSIQAFQGFYWQEAGIKSWSQKSTPTGKEALKPCGELLRVQCLWPCLASFLRVGPAKTLSFLYQKIFIFSLCAVLIEVVKSR